MSLKLKSVLVLAALGAVVVVGAPSATASPPTLCGSGGVYSVVSGFPTCTYSYTGAQDTFTVPAGVTSISTTAIGAAGGSTCSDNSGGGQGASVTGSGITVSPGATLHVSVGGAGGYSCGGGSPGTGGFGGGADGGAGGYVKGGGGGGASLVSTTASPTLPAQLYVVGGGGGGGGICDGTGGNAGSAGGGGCAGDGPGGQPGTSSAGGNGGSVGAGNGSFLQGGAGETAGQGGGGGGGGLYGGGGGAVSSDQGSAGGGGGGSSYITPSASTFSGPTVTGSAASVSISWALKLSAGTTTCNGGYAGTGRYVVVPWGDTCTLAPGTHVTRDVTVLGGTLNANGVTIDRNLSIYGSATVCNSSIGSVEATGGSLALGGPGCTGNTISGSVLVLFDAHSVTVWGNTVRGGLTVMHGTGATDSIDANSITRDFLVEYDGPPVDVSNNHAANARCIRNKGQTGSGNTATHTNTCPAGP